MVGYSNSSCQRHHNNYASTDLKYGRNYSWDRKSINKKDKGKAKIVSSHEPAPLNILTNNYFAVLSSRQEHIILDN